MKNTIHNEIYHYIHALGGPSFVARRLKISTSTIHGWIRAGKVSNMEKLIQLKELGKIMQEIRKI
jgi:predicted site-specific integrase-resolvase